MLQVRCFSLISSARSFNALCGRKTASNDSDSWAPCWLTFTNPFIYSQQKKLRTYGEGSDPHLALLFSQRSAFHHCPVPRCDFCSLLFPDTKFGNHKYGTKKPDRVSLLHIALHGWAHRSHVDSIIYFRKARTELHIGPLLLMAPKRSRFWLVVWCARSVGHYQCRWRIMIYLGQYLADNDAAPASLRAELNVGKMARISAKTAKFRKSKFNNNVKRKFFTHFMHFRCCLCSAV